MQTTIQRKTDIISAIIEKRRPIVQRIESVEHSLKALTESLILLQRQHTVHSVSAQERGYLPEIDVASLQSNISVELQALGKLKKRFSRNTLNIGVIGRARQGKSRLLQSLSGLTADEIPDGDRQHCTGVRSTICHQKTPEAYGEVWFHSEQSFLNDVIAPYYEKLQLGSKPLSLDSFAKEPLPPLPEAQHSYAEPGAMHEHLKRYHTYFDKYAHLLGAPPKRIPRAEIREYVAQDTADGQRVFFNYLAVQEVKISCLFPHEEVGQIALVDMPGLGDTGVGDESRLVQTLGQDVDVVLFVRMPKSSGDYWADVDVRLYDVARQALPMLPLEQWSYLVLNHTDKNSKNGDNWNNCEDLRESLVEKHIRVVQQITANCANDAEAEKLLDSVLQYMTENIVRLDYQYAGACQASLMKLQAVIAAELQKVNLPSNQENFQTNWLPLFETLFSEAWDGLTGGLEKLMKRSRENRYQPEGDFKNRVEAAILACKEDPGLPTLEEIEIRRNRVGAYRTAYESYLHEVRAHLSRHFLVVDEALKKGLDQAKSLVANVLVEEGQLGGLTDARSTAFLGEIIQRMPDQIMPGEPSQIKFGFQILESFSLSYRGLIQHRIRKHLDDLTPDTTKLKLSDSPSATEILECLTTLQAEAVYKCRTALNDLLSEPNQAAFAILEEFTDRVLRAEDVEKEWRIFFAEMRNEIWQEQFRTLEERSKRHLDWLNAVRSAVAANEVEKLNFLG